jgi:hypothetical protein
LHECHPVQSRTGPSKRRSLAWVYGVPDSWVNVGNVVTETVDDLELDDRGRVYWSAVGCKAVSFCNMSGQEGMTSRCVEPYGGTLIEIQDKP